MEGAAAEVERLRAELAMARAEIERLRSENARLRPDGGSGGARDVHRSERAPRLFVDTGGTDRAVDGTSPREDKVRLFRSLFRGREDVYAQRWENPSAGKAGWSPVTIGRRGPSGHPAYAAVDDQVVARHLSGGLVAGVYPLVDGDRCWFLAADFDKRSWALDASAYLQVCQDIGVPASLERSRSGDGGHVWVFFAEPTDAAVARRLGTGLLREAMALRVEVDLASYDRLFPSQDFVPERGFGNLIALPLQGQSRRHGNAVFVDPATLEPWGDQWAFLSSIRRLPAAEARSIGDELTVAAGPGSSSARTTRRRSTYPMPPIVPAQLGAHLSIHRIGLPPPLVATLKHLASLHNPEFHQRQQLRLSTWNTPRMIRCYEEDLDTLHLPRGLLEEAAGAVAAAGGRLEVDDRRPSAPSYSFTFTGSLTSSQSAAVDDLAEAGSGVLVAPTGAGKTVMACALVGRLGTPTLILVHTRTLAEQWRQRLTEFLDVPSRSIGQLGAGRTRTTEVIDIVTLPTLARRNDGAEVFEGYGLVIVDECHHLPAVTFERCVRGASNRRWVGLTATPHRRDGLEGILHMQLGPTRHVVPDDANRAFVRRDLIVHDTLCDPATPDDAAVQRVLGALAADDERNRQICTDVADAYTRRRNVLVLSDRTGQVDVLHRQLHALGVESSTLVGGTGKRVHQATVEQLRASPGPIVLIATGAYLGEGFDLPRLDTLFLTFPISGKSRIIQYVGRVTRDVAGKTSVEVHDYLDGLHPLTRRMHQRRSAALRSVGFVAPAR